MMEDLQTLSGNVINFENTIIIMTSNAGSQINHTSIGFGANKDANKNKVLDSLRETFRPEFLNRIDEIVVFEQLDNIQLLQIIDLMLSETKLVLSDKNIIMNVSDEAKNFILQKGTDVKYGARPLRRAIQRYVEDELSDLILKQELQNGQTVNIDLENNELQFKIEN